VRHEVGVDHALWGSDFPHEVSRWPHSREYLEQQFATVPEDETRKMLCENAVKFFNLDK
jgi:predicted TIM-barrel fold metal-dependent hydrolase